jgi:hypothetical protein
MLHFQLAFSAKNLLKAEAILSKRQERFESNERRTAMPKKKAFDPAKLIKMIDDETSQAEIMKKMGFKTSTQLKTAYMSALIAEGKVLAIKGGRGAKKAAKVKTIGVGKRGSLIISKELVQRLGIGAKDKFTLRKTKIGIALKKAEK